MGTESDLPTPISTKTYFLYDGETLLFEMRSDGMITATNTWGANGLVSRRVGTVSTYYLFDQRGATVQRTNSLGTILDSYQTDAYGQVSPTPAADPTIGLGAQWGYYRDAETGLQLCTFRYYDPVEGRWLTQDPIGMAGGLNQYGYCGGNPIDSEDPLGLLSQNGCHYGASRKQYRTAVIAGDTDGHAMLGWALHPYSVSGASKEEVIALMSSVDEVTIWGHGSYTNVRIGPDQTLKPADIDEIRRRRRRLGRGKLELIRVDECCVCSDSNTVNKLLEIAKRVEGYEGWTVDPNTLRPGKVRSYTKPQPKKKLKEGPRNYK